MRELKSGVYYVDYKNIHTFLDHASEYGWDWDSGVEVKDELYDYATEKSIIPFSLDYKGYRIGYWSNFISDDKSEVLDNIENWDDWGFTDKYIEYYQPIKIVLWGIKMNLKDFFKIEDVEFTDEELELPYETYGVDNCLQVVIKIS